MNAARHRLPRTGEAKTVVERLLELKAEAEVDEVVVVTPNLDRPRRRAAE